MSMRASTLLCLPANWSLCGMNWLSVGFSLFLFLSLCGMKWLSAGLSLSVSFLTSQECMLISLCQSH